MENKPIDTLPSGGEAPVETHPFEPFLPPNARLLMLGTFPPAPKRWCMDWYYPNYTNDMWRIMGLSFFGDKMRFVDEAHKTYRLDELKSFLAEVGIAIYDTCRRVRRTTGTASDKDLEVVERADLDALLRALPQCRGVVAAGQLATNLFTSHYGIDARKMRMGDHRDFAFEGRTVSLYRQPSSSRAFPMRLEQKTAYYKQMFEDLGLMTR
ncbi:MAG TPA: DNA glycosylase [Prevotella sp.]|nr:DNA glycosylase [Prevotellaceae bacterium]HBN46410.1 DNA glycosylase [Prevotella sp.]